MHGEDARQKSNKTSTTYPTGAVVTTFGPPPKDFDPMTASPSTLLAYGYPPRPHDSEALAHWKELLGRPLPSIKAEIKLVPKTRHVRITDGTESSSNWSGA